MMPKIEPVAYLGADSKSIATSGPINWNPTANPKDIAAWFTVVVSQVLLLAPTATDAGPAYEIVTAIGASEDAYFTGSTWWATANVIQPANGVKTFQVGGATVAAWASIARDDGGYATYEWTLPVTVRPHSEMPS